jgi:WD40 repeat protein
VLVLGHHQAPVRCLAYSPDSQLLATGDEDGQLLLWDRSRIEQPLASLDCLSGVEALSFAPTGKFLVAGTADGQVIQWDFAQPEIREPAHEGGVSSVLFTPSGRYFLSGGWDGRLGLWSAQHQHLKSEPPLPVPVKALVAAPSGDLLLAACTDGSLYRYDLITGKCPLFLRSQLPLVCLACSPDGQRLAGGANGIITVWDRNTQEVRSTLTGDMWLVFGLGFLPDGRTLVSGNADGTVRLWDLDTGREKQTYRWHSNWVTCLAVSPDGNTAAAGSEDATVVIWDLDGE